MNAIKKICFDKFATAYNNYSIDSKTEYKYSKKR